MSRLSEYPAMDAWRHRAEKAESMLQKLREGIWESPISATYTICRLCKKHHPRHDESCLFYELSEHDLELLYEGRREFKKSRHEESKE